MTSDSVSVIIPAYNEEENIKGAVETAQLVLRKEVPDYEIIIVDDGSTDATGSVADRIAGKNRRVHVIHHPANEGIGAAFRDGLAYASKYYITGFPGDNDFSDTAFMDLVRARSKNHFVSTYMTNMEDREIIRQILSRAFSTLMDLIFRLRLKYYNGYFICPLKFARSVPLKSTGFTFFAEIKIKVIKCGVPFREIPFTYIPRVHGTSKALTWKSIVQTIRFLPVLIRDVFFPKKNVIASE